MKCPSNDCKKRKRARQRDNGASEGTNVDKVGVLTKADQLYREWQLAASRVQCGSPDVSHKVNNISESHDNETIKHRTYSSTKSSPPSYSSLSLSYAKERLDNISRFHPITGHPFIKRQEISLVLE